MRLQNDNWDISPGATLLLVGQFYPKRPGKLKLTSAILILARAAISSPSPSAMSGKAALQPRRDDHFCF